MRPVFLVLIAVAGFLLFGSMTYFMSEVTNSTAWTAMNNSGWETGLMKIMVPMGFAGCCIYAAYMVFKGKDTNNRFGGQG